MKNTFKNLIPSLLLAVGILASSALAVSMVDAGWWVMLGPFAMSLFIVAAGWADLHLFRPEQSLKVPVMMAVIFFAAAAIVALRDPARVPDIVPILGAGAIVVIGPWAGRSHHACCEGKAA